MAVTRPTDGATITTAQVTAMHADVRTVVNDMQPAHIASKALGLQHLPSAVAWLNGTTTPGADVAKVTASTQMLDGVNTRLVAETDADVQNNWTALHTVTAGWQLNNGGAGYVLPPCKVLFMWQAQIRDIDSTDEDNQAWLCPVYSVNGTPVYDIDLAGMVQAFNFSGGAGLVDQQEYTMSGYFLLDQTGAGGTWTMDSLTLRYAGGTGTAGAYPTSTTISSGMLAFIPFYRDA